MATTTQHPGKVLGQHLEALGISPTELARQLQVPANRITQIINGRRGITGDSALRLAHWFENEPGFWMDLQAQYEIAIAEAEVGQAIHALPTQANNHASNQLNRRTR
jgi:addiction module HigA family antidote